MNRTSNPKRRTAALATAIAAAATTALLPLVLAGGAAAEPRAGAGAGERRIERRVMRAPAMRGERAHAMWDRLLAAADDLNLSDTQRDRLRAIRRSAPGALMPKKQAIAEARLDLADLMERKDAGAAELRQAHERLVQARAAMANAAFDLRMQAREVLTPQQRDKLKEQMRTRGRGPGQGRRGGDMRRGDLGPSEGDLSLAPPAPPFDYEPDAQFEFEVEVEDEGVE